MSEHLEAAEKALAAAREAAAQPSDWEVARPFLEKALDVVLDCVRTLELRLGRLERRAGKRPGKAAMKADRRKRSSSARRYATALRAAAADELEKVLPGISRQIDDIKRQAAELDDIKRHQMIELEQAIRAANAGEN